MQRDSNDGRLLLAAERAVEIGAGILRRGRSHIGGLIAKGDRDFATDVDIQIETAIRTSLAEAVPGGVPVRSVARARRGRVSPDAALARLCA